MANTQSVAADTTPDSLRALLEAFDLLIDLAEKKASVGQIHDAVFFDVVKYLIDTKTALNSDPELH